jgi:hypothetical protein
MFVVGLLLFWQIEEARLRMRIAWPPVDMEAVGMFSSCGVAPYGYQKDPPSRFHGGNRRSSPQRCVPSISAFIALLVVSDPSSSSRLAVLAREGTMPARWMLVLADALGNFWSIYYL